MVIGTSHYKSQICKAYHQRSQGPCPEKHDLLSSMAKTASLLAISSSCFWPARQLFLPCPTIVFSHWLTFSPSNQFLYFYSFIYLPTILTQFFFKWNSIPSSNDTFPFSLLRPIFFFCALCWQSSLFWAVCSLRRVSKHPVLSDYQMKHINVFGMFWKYNL